MRDELCRLAAEAWRTIGTAPKLALLNRLKRRTAQLLFGDRILALPQDFLETTLNLSPDAPLLEIILKAWSPERLLRYREEVSRDLDAREWRTVLQVTKEVIGGPAESERNFDAQDELAVSNGWRKCHVHFHTHCRTRKDAVMIALRVIEAIHQERPFSITCVRAFGIRKESPDWQLTGNEAVPAVRFSRDGRMIWCIAKSETLRRLWDLMRTL